MAGYGAGGGGGVGRADDGRGAEKNGVRLRKVFAGIEIVELGLGGAGREGGAEFAEAGFEVGDVITKVDNASVIGEETSCAEALRMIAEGQGGVGQAFVEGFRRVPAFPRPTRSAVRPRVPDAPGVCCSGAACSPLALHAVLCGSRASRAAAGASAARFPAESVPPHSRVPLCLLRPDLREGGAPRVFQLLPGRTRCCEGGGRDGAQHGGRIVARGKRAAEPGHQRTRKGAPRGGRV